MESISQEVRGALESLLQLLHRGRSSSCDAATATTSRSSSTSQPLPLSRRVGSHELRRVARRLDRAVQALETICDREQTTDLSSLHQQQQQQLQSDLVVLLTAVPQALEELHTASTSQDWRNHDVLELYDSTAQTAARVLLGHFLPLTLDEQLDALVDRIASLLVLHTETTSPLMSFLVTCVHIHLTQHSQDETTTLFPFLAALETIQLLQLILPRSCQDMERRWTSPPQTIQEEGRYALASLAAFLLQHLSHVRELQGPETNSCNEVVHVWLQRQFMFHAQAPQRYTSPDLLLQDVNNFCNQSQTFAVELVEYALDVLDGAISSTAMDDSHTDSGLVLVREAVRHTSLACTTVSMLQSLELPHPPLRSLWAAYATFVAISCRSEDDTDTRMYASDVLITLTKMVMQQQQQNDGSAQHAPSSFETAMAVTLLTVLDTPGRQADLDILLEWLCPLTTADCNSLPKRRKCAVADTTFEQSGWTHVLQASVMASLMLPTASHGTTTLPKPIVAKLVQSMLGLPHNKTKNPWHSLLSRKVAESYHIDPTNRKGNHEESWYDRVLANYVVDHASNNARSSEIESSSGETIVAPKALVEHED